MCRRVRMWTLKPKKEGDYNVPTPIIYDGKLLVTTRTMAPASMGLIHQARSSLQHWPRTWSLHRKRIHPWWWAITSMPSGRICTVWI